MNAVDRQIRIFALICSQRLTSHVQLAKQFEVSYRTIRRDVIALMSNYPLEIIRGRNGGVRLEDWFQPSSSYLTNKQLIQSAKDGAEAFLNTCDTVFGDRCYWPMDGAMRAVLKKLERQYHAAKESSFDDETCVQIILGAQQTTNALKEMYDIRRRTTGTPANTAKGYYTTAMTYTRYLVQALDPDSRLFPNTTHYAGPPYVRNRERDEMIYHAYMEDQRSIASIAEEQKISISRVRQILRRLKDEGQKKAKQQKWKAFISRLTNIYYCDACRYTFSSVAVPERCPDCGAVTVRPATEEQIADYERIQKEIEAEIEEEKRMQ